MTSNLRVLRSSFATTCRLLLIVGLLLSASAFAWNVEDGFSADANSSVYSLTVQDDGKIIVGGAFTTINGQARTYLARLNADGSLDPGFAAIAVDDQVSAVLVQADGRIVIGGKFAQVGAQLRNSIARLNVDGSLDASYNPNVAHASGSFFRDVESLAMQGDGKLVIGGSFTSVGGVARRNIARLNNDGSVDASYDPDPSSRVYALAIQADGKLLMGGSFSQVGGLDRPYIARLQTDGSLDATYQPTSNADFVVYALAIEPDGKLLVAGGNSGADANATRMLRLNVDGSRESTFFGIDDIVETIAVQADGKVVIGGRFTKIGNNPAYAYVARFRLSGSTDSDFRYIANNTVNSLAIQSDGKLLLGGFFSTIKGEPRARLARLNADGDIDSTLNPGANGYVAAIAQMASGKLLVGGAFTTLDGAASSRLTRLETNGSLDGWFPGHPGTNLPVAAMVLQRDGKFVVGGQFSTIGEEPRNRLARVIVNEFNDIIVDIDPAFNPGADGNIYALAQQADGKLIVAGNFSNIGGQPRVRLARLNTDGSVDGAFDPSPNDSVYSIAMQADGKILVAGNFSMINGIPRNRIARLNANGSVDGTFTSIGDGTVYVMSLQPDGRLLVGGDFDTIGGLARSNFARLNSDGSADATYVSGAGGIVYTIALQADGNVMLGGTFSTVNGQFRNNIALLNANGSLDAGFDPGADATIYALALQADGKLVAGGDFGTFGGQPRSKLARLSAPQTVIDSLEIIGYTNGGSVIRWNRTGSAPELAQAPELEFSVAGSTYGGIGTMHRSGSSWRYVGYAPPLGTAFYLRATGTASSGLYNGSSSQMRSTRQAHLDGNDGIYIDGFQ